MNGDLREKLGKRIKEVRKSKDLTQKTLAEKCDTTTEYIYFIESGNKTPSTEMYIKLSLALDIPLDELFLI
ncbi:helix-turn-helix domain-containing protein [Eubacterium sp. MSJ-33]|uniref:helix-turn-helix domain-containing protein n=1 Tax=Eubacterium sp. MSJ-33 TaxID=2841528 RepID=UPI001C76527D|nr:helix-turn-helix transcriptional regulator [Eubacterium sp. MSJ-33]QWT53027.1 helix-turn-helix domain-containing protein [Eubacterium sp. MSJ-33]